MLVSIAKYLGVAFAEKLAHLLMKAATDFFLSQKTKETNDKYNEIAKERRVLYKTISEAKTNEERKYLSVAVAKLMRYEQLSQHKPSENS